MAPHPHPRPRSPHSPTRARASFRGRSSSACRDSGRTGTISPPTRSSAAPPRSCASGRSGSACPRCWCRRARRHGPRRRPLLRRPDGGARRGRHHGHQRQDHDRLPRAPPARGRRARAAGCSARSSAWSAGREEEVERTTPEAIDLQRTFRAHGRRRRQRLRDGGLLARARARAGVRHPLRLPGVHEPDPGPPRLPPLDGGLLPRQAAPVRRTRAGRRMRRTWTTSTGAASPARSSAPRSRSSATPTTARATSSSTPRARASSARRPTARSRSSRRCPGSST